MYCGTSVDQGLASHQLMTEQSTESLMIRENIELGSDTTCHNGLIHFLENSNVEWHS